MLCVCVHQGDPLAMPMYALALLPLINSLSDDAIKLIWYAASCGQIEYIRSWWDKLVQIGPFLILHKTSQRKILVWQTVI